jgi:hypothetical protein
MFKNDFVELIVHSVRCMNDFTENSDPEAGEEQPTPPLPEKTAYSDYSNIEIAPPAPSYHRSNSGNRKSKVSLLRIFHRGSTASLNESDGHDSKT